MPMKKNIPREEAREKIAEFFLRENFNAEEVRKIKRLAMKFNIKLGIYRREFCRKCLNKLKGKVRILKNHKTVECENCGCKNRLVLRVKQA